MLFCINLTAGSSGFRVLVSRLRAAVSGPPYPRWWLRARGIGDPNFRETL